MAQSTAFGFLNHHHCRAEEILDPALINNGEGNTMLGAIRAELRRCDHFVFSVAFITSSALAMLKQELLDYTGTGEFITSTYLGFNEPTIFEELLDLGRYSIRVHDNPETGFHAKGYVFHSGSHVTAIVGSSNLTDRALTSNHEWNLKFSAAPEGQIALDLAAATSRQHDESRPVTHEWIADYEKRRPHQSVIVVPDADNSVVVGGKITPNAMQTEALERLSQLREAGERRALIISATGTGKTILAALAVREARPRKMLFVVHREQILDKAMSEFQRVLERPRSDFGKLVGQTDESDRPFVFATIQSLSRESTLDQLAPDTFDYIVIDEVHRTGAASYQRVINHFTPDGLLGLTATPERTDDFNVFELFDFNVPYEIRLQAALEANMLVPFHYYGVTDYIDDDNETVDDVATLARLVAPERVGYIVQMLERYGHRRGTKGLMFCRSIDEAQQLSALLNERTVHGKPLRTAALAGSSSMAEREKSVRDLEEGVLDYLLTVDIFNEGIDIPPVNQVVMLRQTQSSIVFTQQLGRGLRKHAGKDHLRVIDFIGNYKNNYLIPVALFGENSRDKDRIRERLIDVHADNTIAKISSVNFEEIAQERVFASIARSAIDSMTNLKKDIQTLQERLGHIPRLMDFAFQDTADPVLLAGKVGNYWELLARTKFVDVGPSEQEGQFLAFLSKELLPGKRPHELIVLKELVIRTTNPDTDPVLTRDEVRQLYERKGVGAPEDVVSSVERVLTYEFYKQQQMRMYGSVPIVQIDHDEYRLSPEFAQALAGQRFGEHVDDVVATGLHLARHRESWGPAMVVGNKYSRREVCRLLGFRTNEESTVYGYKVDEFSGTCPIFVTYHKDDDVSASTKYLDAFRNPGTMHWYTRSRRTLASGEVQKILSGKFRLHLFVKKDDAEGTDFFYLGEVATDGAEERSMPGSDGELPVVTMDLTLASTVESQLYDYLNTSIELGA